MIPSRMKSIRPRFVNSVLALFIALALPCGAEASVLDGAEAVLHLTQTITGPDGVCKKVTNESVVGLSVYVPTSTVAEWQSFTDHPPTGVTIGSCVTCPVGQIPVPDDPTQCARVMTVYSGYQIPYTCGHDLPDIGRCYLSDTSNVVEGTGCLYDVHAHGTCIEGYDCPYDGWMVVWDASVQAISAECNNKLWDSAHPGPRCVPVGQLGAQNCLANPAPIMPSPPPFGSTQCHDGLDNDGDGYTDIADTCGCTTPDDNDEGYDASLCPWGDFHVSGTVICTELNRQGLIPDGWMDADARFGAQMPAIVMNGYHAWARPVVSLMQRSHAFTMFVYAFAHPWAQEMAYLQGVEDHGSFLGILVMVVGVPFSALVGIFVTPWW